MTHEKPFKKDDIVTCNDIKSPLCGKTGIVTELFGSYPKQLDHFKVNFGSAEAPDEHPLMPSQLRHADELAAA